MTNKGFTPLENKRKKSLTGFTHLHLHSQYSLLDGSIVFEELLKRCKKLEMDSVAVTDHGNLFGAIEFYTKAIAAHIKPIIGIEAYIASAVMMNAESILTK